MNFRLLAANGRVWRVLVAGAVSIINVAMGAMRRGRPDQTLADRACLGEITNQCRRLRSLLGGILIDSRYFATVRLAT